MHLLTPAQSIRKVLHGSTGRALNDYMPKSEWMNEAVFKILRKFGGFRQQKGCAMQTRERDEDS